MGSPFYRKGLTVGAEVDWAAGNSTVLVIVNPHGKVIAIDQGD